jgi:hypothetical protein
MKSDGYTRAVLTVIAAALIYIATMMSGVPAAAQAPFGAAQLSQSRPQPVVVVGWGKMRADGDIEVSTIRDRRGVVTSDPNMPVKVVGSDIPVAVTLGVTPEHPLPVGLTAVTPGQDWEPIRTKVEPAPTQKVPGPGK